MADTTGQGFVKAGRRIARAKVDFDPQEFSRFAAKRLKLGEFAREMAREPLMEIDYTMARTEAGIAQIGRFLGVDPSRFRPQQTAKRIRRYRVAFFQSR